MDRILKDMEFIVQLDKMKTVLRQTQLIGSEQREDDAQHSWHIAVMTMVLSDYADEKIDSSKVIKMLLIHDLVELYAGDTFCYDAKGNEDKKSREMEAADKIFGMLDENKAKEFRSLWDEFEDMETPEALFAASMDRLQPMLNNYYNGGGTWKKHEIAQRDIFKRISPMEKSSKKLWEFVEFMLEDAYNKGLISKK